METKTGTAAAIDVTRANAEYDAYEADIKENWKMYPFSQYIAITNYQEGESAGSQKTKASDIRGFGLLRTR